MWLSCDRCDLIFIVRSKCDFIFCPGLWKLAMSEQKHFTLSSINIRQNVARLKTVSHFYFHQNLVWFKKDNIVDLWLAVTNTVIRGAFNLNFTFDFMGNSISLPGVKPCLSELVCSVF